MINYRPMGFHLVVQKDEFKKEVESGLEVPDAAKRAQKTGTVIAIPIRDAQNEHLFIGDTFCNIVPGDKVMFFERAGVLHEGNYLIKIMDIIAKFEQ